MGFGKKVVDSIPNQFKDWDMFPGKKGNLGVWLNISKTINMLKWERSCMAELFQGKLGGRTMTSFLDR